MNLIELTRDELADMFDERIASNDTMYAGCLQALNLIRSGTASLRREYYAHCGRYWDIDNPSHDVSMFHNGFAIVMESELNIPFRTNCGGICGTWGTRAC